MWKMSCCGRLGYPPKHCRQHSNKSCMSVTVACIILSAVLHACLACRAVSCSGCFLVLLTFQDTNIENSHTHSLILTYKHTHSLTKPSFQPISKYRYQYNKYTRLVYNIDTDISMNSYTDNDTRKSLILIPVPEEY